MKKVWFKIFLTILLSGVLAPSFVLRAQDIQTAKNLGVETASRSVFLFDAQTNQPIFSKNPDEKLPLASLTKLMTALLVYENQPNWSEYVKITATDQRKGGVAYLIPGEEIKKEDLWNLMLVASSNQATAALAHSLKISDDEFTALMNQRAGELGLRRLSFKDCTGLNPENIGTAREAAALARVVFSLPKVRESSLKKDYLFAPRGKKFRWVKSTDELLASFLNREPYQIISAKTGYLEESQYNFVFAAGKNDSAVDNSELKTDERQLIGVVLGNPTSADRFQEMKGLIYWGFERYWKVGE